MICKQAKFGYRVINEEANLEVLVAYKYKYNDYIRVGKNHKNITQQYQPYSSHLSLFHIDSLLDKVECTISIGRPGSSDAHQKYILGTGESQRHKLDYPNKAIGRSLAYARAVESLKSDNTEYVTNSEQANLVLEMLEYGVENSNYNWSDILIIE